MSDECNFNFKRCIAFGVQKPKRLRGFPKGRKRIRMRNTEYTRVYVRPREGGIREFTIYERNGEWWPLYEQGANVIEKIKKGKK
jgi:hypothetical protein